MTFPKIPLTRDRVLTGHVPRSLPDDVGASRSQRVASHLPLKVRHREAAPVPPAAAAVAAPRSAALSSPPRLPHEIMVQIAGHLDPLSLLEFRLASREFSLVGREATRSIRVKRLADLDEALRAYAPGGIDHVNFYNCRLGNEDAARVVVAAPSVDLSSNEITAEGARIIAACPTLVDVALDYNGLFPDGASALAQSRTIRSLRARSCLIKDAGATSLAASTTLKSLDITDNRITDTGAEALAQSVSIVDLKLGNNYIRAEGARLLAQSRTIERLDLSMNWIDDEAVSHLLANDKLTHLDVSRNPRITARGLAALEAARPRFEELWCYQSP